MRADSPEPRLRGKSGESAGQVESLYRALHPGESGRCIRARAGDEKRIVVGLVDALAEGVKLSTERKKRAAQRRSTKGVLDSANRNVVDRYGRREASAISAIGRWRRGRSPRRLGRQKARVGHSSLERPASPPERRSR